MKIIANDVQTENKAFLIRGASLPGKNIGTTEFPFSIPSEFDSAYIIGLVNNGVLHVSKDGETWVEAMECEVDDHTYERVSKIERKNRMYVYPAVFKKHDDGRYSAYFWDFEEGFYAVGDTLEECVERAGFLLCMLVRFYVESWGGDDYNPTPIEEIEAEEGEIVSYVFANLGMYC